MHMDVAIHNLNILRLSCFFVVVGFLLSSPALADTDLKINGCNFAPYPVALHWVNPDEDEDGSTLLEAGECNSIHGNITKLAYPNTRLFAEPIPSKGYDYLKNKEWYSSFWNEMGIGNTQWPSAQTDGLIYCANQINGLIKPYSGHGACPHNSEARFYSAPLNFNENGRADWIIMDFAICDRLTDIDCYGDTALNEISMWASEMGEALKRLSDYRSMENTPIGGLYPTKPGVMLGDTNRMFNAGLTVTSALRQTPFGTPVQLQEGDEIIFFNGKKVFGQEINLLIIEAAKRHGYNHANEIIYRRNGALYKTGLALFFDENIYGSAFILSDGSCREPIILGALAALNEFLFYQQSNLSCLYEDTTSNRHINRDQCVFEREQFLAASKQFCPKVNFTGSLAGGLSYALRGLVEKVAIKTIPGIGGKNIYSKVARAAILEVAEESLRTIYTQPPGLNTRAVMDDIVARGKLQGAIGVGFQVSPVITGAFLIPMVYNMYQQY